MCLCIQMFIFYTSLIQSSLTYHISAALSFGSFCVLRLSWLHTKTLPPTHTTRHIWFSSCIQVNSGSGCFLTAIKPRQSSFGSRPRRSAYSMRVIPMFSPAQTNHTKEGNASGFESNEVNGAYLKSPKWVKRLLLVIEVNVCVWY